MKWHEGRKHQVENEPPHPVASLLVRASSFSPRIGRRIEEKCFKESCCPGKEIMNSE